MTQLPNDGYTRSMVINGETLLYRPLIGDERSAAVAAFRSGGDKFVEQIFADQWPDTETTLPVKRRAFLNLIDGERQDDLDTANLASGVWLELRHPYVARRSCEHCKVWWYRHYEGTVVERAGKFLQRPPGTPVPCESEEGCAKGTPEKTRSLTPRNAQAYAHYKKCRWLGFQDDPIVLRNAEIIRNVEERYFADRIARGVGTQLSGAELSGGRLLLPRAAGR